MEGWWNSKIYEKKKKKKRLLSTKVENNLIFTPWFKLINWCSSTDFIYPNLKIIQEGKEWREETERGREKRRNLICFTVYITLLVWYFYCKLQFSIKAIYFFFVLEVTCITLYFCIFSSTLRRFRKLYLTVS